MKHIHKENVTAYSQTCVKLLSARALHESQMAEPDIDVSARFIIPLCYHFTPSITRVDYKPAR